MGQKNLWYSASVRKPVTNTGAAIAFGDDCIRVGDHPGIGEPEWKYEIPFSEIAQIEMRSIKDVLRGTLKDGTEFDIRFKATANLAKQARRPSDMEKALKKIDAASLGGGSIRSVETESGHGAAHNGCLGCGATTLAALTVASAVVAISRLRGSDG